MKTREFQMHMHKVDRQKGDGQKFSLQLLIPFLNIISTYFANHRARYSKAHASIMGHSKAITPL